MIILSQYHNEVNNIAKRLVKTPASYYSFTAYVFNLRHQLTISIECVRHTVDQDGFAVDSVTGDDVTAACRAGLADPFIDFFHVAIGMESFSHFLLTM